MAAVGDTWLVTGRPAEEVTSGPILLRRYRGDEGRMLMAAVNESLEHLRPWMPWADHPHSEEEQDEFVRRAVAQWESGEGFSYYLQERATGACLGGAALHPRIGEGALEIGYWIHVAHTGRGYATMAAHALTTAAFELDEVERVEIHCDEANVASAAVPRRLGFSLAGTEKDVIEAPGEVGRSLIWRVDRAAWLA